MTNRLVLMAAFLAVSACSVPALGPQQTTGPRAAVDATTLALSCSALTTRNNRIGVRLSELERQSQAQARQAAVTDAVVGIGLGAVLGVGAQGGVSGLRTASATIQGVEAVRAAERGNASMQNVTDVLALAGRSVELQRAMIEKGCP
ncbi:hypothetical protein [Yoonia sp. SS1-5]|uniref:Glycine zipper family protein n=1 Tax=Yoonia rhodophyticola TaxID=3137370 RepID=A0AAN0NJ57_9RHOB